jgi:AcrR family transcriptional regulator
MELSERSAGQAARKTGPAPATASRILKTAHDLFYRDGIRATGIDRIIAESGVAKKTFYRYYPAKDDLVVSFLDYRHRNWISWFESALERHGGDAKAIIPVMAEWFESKSYRGCAFINSVIEVGGALPETVGISRRHKADMTAAIRAALPSSSRTANADARAIALAVNGAIVSAQLGEPVSGVLKSLAKLINAVTGTSP